MPRGPIALAVDDDLMHSKLMSAVLQKFGIPIETVSSSRQFIQRLKVLRPDICFIDLNIESPGIGYTIIRAVRKVLGSRAVLIAVSGVSHPGAIARAIDVGADDFIIKPVDRQVLAAKISRYVVTDQLLSSHSPLFPVPAGGAPAVLRLDFFLKKVGVNGISLLGKSVLSKGLSLHLGGPILQEITARPEPQLYTVTSTWVEPGSDLYGAEAAFDRGDRDLMMAVRRWLALKHSDPVLKQSLKEAAIYG